MKIDPARLARELEQMRELIATDPAVRARFDTNGDGEIDGNEWHVVRQLVLRRLMAEALEAEAAHVVAEQQAIGQELPTELGEAGQLPRQPEGTDGSVAAAVFARDVAPAAQSPPADLFQHGRWTLDRSTERLAPLGLREYRVLDFRGQPSGEIVGRGGPGEATLEFDVRDMLTGKRYVLQRTAPPPRSCVVLFDPDGPELAFASQDARRRGFSCRVRTEDGELVVQRKWWDPQRYTISVGSEVGEIETSARAQGLGGATTRVYARGALPLEARYGLFAASLLIDLLDDGGDASEHVETGAALVLKRLLSRDDSFW